MQQVTQAEFYAAIGPLDVEVSVRGQYENPDYGSDFRLKGSRRLMGRTVCVGPHPRYKPDTTYWLPAEGGR